MWPINECSVTRRRSWTIVLNIGPSTPGMSFVTSAVQLIPLNIMQKAVHNFSGTISINGREISNLQFADDIDLIAGTEEELQELTTTLERRARAYGMEISAEKSKIMVNSRIPPITAILMNGERLEEVKSFKYIGSIISSDGDSTEEIRTRINLATSAIARLKKI